MALCIVGTLLRGVWLAEPMAKFYCGKITMRGGRIHSLSSKMKERLTKDFKRGSLLVAAALTAFFFLIVLLLERIPSW